ncbi:MAG: hypothetical protein ACYCW5_01385 [Thermoleophilia bacterium]
MGDLTEWPELRDEETQKALKQGLGGSRYKDYDAAPYGYLVHASIPSDLWDAVFLSWMSLKGHLQGLHDLHRTEVFATRAGDRIYAIFITIWTYRETMVAWMEHGYPADEMLRSEGVNGDDIVVTLMRDYS